MSIDTTEAQELLEKVQDSPEFKAEAPMSNTELAKMRQQHVKQLKDNVEVVELRARIAEALYKEKVAFAQLDHLAKQLAMAAETKGPEGPEEQEAEPKEVV